MEKPAKTKQVLMIRSAGTPIVSICSEASKSRSSLSGSAAHGYAGGHDGHGIDSAEADGLRDAVGRLAP